MHLKSFAFATLLVLLEQATPTPALEFPETGFRFRCDANARPPININGWQCYGGGFYSNNGNNECCIDNFHHLQLKSRQVARDGIQTKSCWFVQRSLRAHLLGGIDTEEVLEWVLVERKNTEEFMQESSDCAMNGQGAFLLGVLDRRKKTLVSVSWDGTKFRQTFNNWRIFPCANDF